MVPVDYGQWYLFDAEGLEDMANLLDDPVATAEVWERKCVSYGRAAMVYTRKQFGPTRVEARTVAEPSSFEDADHVVEFSVEAPSGRLAFTGWDSSVVVGTLAVPAGPVRLRVAWIGLTSAEAADRAEDEAFRIDVFEGPPAPIEVIRWWPAWAVPDATLPRSNGLRSFVGRAAAAAREPMTWVPRAFWSPYPTIVDGEVSSLWRDAEGTTWASGTGPGSHGVLWELTPDEARDIEAQGFESVRTYAIDEDGRIWTSDVMPLERVPCLNLVPQWQFEMVKDIPGGLIPTQVIDLPAGWSRLIRRSRGTGSPPEEVSLIDDDGAFFYQRWRDDQPAPTR
jgi:hypothetical protein